MTFDYKEHLMNEQIDYAWEVLMDAKKNNEHFKRVLNEYYGSDYGIQWGYISLEGEMEKVFEYMLENDWDYAIKEPVRAFCQNYDRCKDEEVSLQEDIGYDNYSPIILDEHMNKYNSKLERV